MAIDWESLRHALVGHSIDDSGDSIFCVEVEKKAEREFKWFFRGVRRICKRCAIHRLEYVLLNHIQ